MEGLNTEELYQKVYNLERALNVSESMRDNMQQDIESLQAQLNSTDTTFQEYKKKIEFELSNKWMEKVTSLGVELDDERETSAKIISDLKKKINNLENQELTPLDNGINDNIKDQLNKTIDENLVLKKQIGEVNLLLENCEEDKKNLDTKIRNLEERYQETCEILDSKKEALLETTEALKDIQEEKALLSSELAALKAGPIDEDRRGNSLFAEVEDNRQLLMKNISLLKSKLAEAKIKLSSKNLEIVKLRNDNDRLHYKIQKADRDVKPECITLIEGYKARINELEFLINKLQKQESQNKIPTNESRRMEWAFNSLEKSRTELRDFQKQFNNLSQQRLLDLEKLSASQREISNLKSEINCLKLNLDQKASEDTPKIDETKNHSDNLDSNKRNGAPEESDKTLKEVRFAEGTK